MRSGLSGVLSCLVLGVLVLVLVLVLTALVPVPVPVLVCVLGSRRVLVPAGARGSTSVLVPAEVRGPTPTRVLVTLPRPVLPLTRRTAYGWCRLWWWELGRPG